MTISSKLLKSLAKLPVSCARRFCILGFAQAIFGLGQGLKAPTWALHESRAA